MRKIFKITAILLIVAGGFSACCNEPEDVFTKTFYVHGRQADECGHFLFGWRSSLNHPFGDPVWAQNLPEEFQIPSLPVIVTFRIVEERGGDCRYPVINIIRIRKQ